MSDVPDPDPAVELKFLTELHNDITSGSLRSIEHYQARYPGHEALVAAQFTAIVEAAEATEEPGTERRPFGRYELLRRLGQGAQGTVHLAWDRAMRRRVALKILSAGALLSGSARQRFQRESAAVAELHHPCLCPLFDAGEHEGVPYIAMQFVEGSSLQALLEDERARRTQGARPGPERRARVREILLLVEKLARALHVAHESGLIHRDVKPGNVQVTPSGEPVLLDFGLAHLEDETQSRITGSGDFMGTPAYLAPEALGDARRVDRRVDVYALTVLLFESLTLRRPFQEATRAQLLRAILMDSPPDPRRLEAVLPRDLRTVIEVGLEKSPDRRYATALDLAEDLERVREGRAPRARRPGPLVRGTRWVRRNAAAALLLTTLAVSATLAALFVPTWLRERESLHRERESLERERGERRRIEYAQQIARLRAMQAMGTTDGALDVLESTDPELRGFEYEFLSARLQEWRRAYEHGPKLSLLAADPHSDRFFSAGSDGSLIQWSREAPEPRRDMPGHEQPITAMELSPDGAWLLTGDEAGGLKIWDARTGELFKSQPQAHTKAIVDFAFSPDLPVFVTSGKDRKARVWLGGVLVMTIPTESEGALLTVHPRGSLVGAWGPENGGFISIWTLPSPAEQRSLSASASSEQDRQDKAEEMSQRAEYQKGDFPFDGTKGRAFTDLRFDDEGRFLIATGPTGQYSVWDLWARYPEYHGNLPERRDLPVRTSSTQRLEPVFAIPFASSVRRMSAGGAVGEPFSGPRSRVVAATHQGPDVLLAAEEDGRILEWDLRRRRAFDSVGEVRDVVMSVALDASGRRAVYHGNMAHALLVDLETGTSAFLDSKTNWVRGRTCGFLGGGEYLVLCDYTARMEVWHVPTRQRVLDEEGPRFDWNIVATQRGGRWVARCRRGGEVELVRLRLTPAAVDSELVRTLPGSSSVLELSFDPSGERLAIGRENGDIEIVLVAQDEPSDRLRARAAVGALAFSADGTRLAAGTRDGWIQLYSMEDGEELQRWRTGFGGVSGLRWLHGDRLVSSGETAPVQLWNTEEGSPLLELGGGSDAILDLDASDDGRTLIGGGWSGRGLLWSARPPSADGD